MTARPAIERHRLGGPDELRDDKQRRLRLIPAQHRQCLAMKVGEAVIECQAYQRLRSGFWRLCQPDRHILERDDLGRLRRVTQSAGRAHRASRSSCRHADPRIHGGDAVIHENAYTRAFGWPTNGRSQRARQSRCPLDRVLHCHGAWKQSHQLRDVTGDGRHRSHALRRSHPGRRHPSCRDRWVREMMRSNAALAFGRSSGRYPHRSR